MLPLRRKGNLRRGAIILRPISAHSGCKWARHSEFTSLTFTRHGENFRPFATPALLHVPEDWLKQIPEKLAAAPRAGSTTLATRPHRGNRHRIFPRQRLDWRANRRWRRCGVYRFSHTCRRIFALLISDIPAWSASGGRMLQRLFEIDTYRMMAFLTLPLAKNLSPHHRADGRAYRDHQDKWRTPHRRTVRYCWIA